MSKYVKGLVSDYLQQRLKGVDSAFLVNVSGLSATQAVVLRSDLRKKNIQLLVVKNSLAERATGSTALASAFKGRTGSTAVIWGGDDVVSLAKEVVRIAKDKNFAPFAATGGVLDGSLVPAAEVEAISKWPKLTEMLAWLAGQILVPGAQLAGQILGPASSLASQIKQKGEGEEKEPAAGDVVAGDVAAKGADGGAVDGGAAEGGEAKSEEAPAADPPPDASSPPASP